MKAFIVLAIGALTLFAVSTASAGRLEWQTPTERQNGAALSASEIGGFEIRYGNESVVIPDGTATHYTLGHLEPGEYVFEIAVFDIDGLYSEFVQLSPVTRPAQPASVPGFIYRSAVYSDPVEACADSPRCRVEMLSARYGRD